MEKHKPSKNQVPSKVRRFPLYRRPGANPAALAPPTKEPAKQENPTPPSSNWSNWQFIKEPLWEGYWRASAQEDGELALRYSMSDDFECLTESTGGWHYHFTKDGKTIWEQKVPKPEMPKPEAPKPAAASSKTNGERVFSGEIPATALTTDHTVPWAPSSKTTITADDGIRYPFSNDTALSSLYYDLRALTLRGCSNSEAPVNKFRQKRAPQRQGRGIYTTSSLKDRRFIINHRDTNRDYPIVYSEETRAPKTASAAREGHHGALAGSWEAGRHKINIGEVVSAEKKKRFNAKKIVDIWQWG